MSGVVSFFASGPQGQQGRAGLLTLRRGSRCERAQHGPRSAHPSPTPGATVRRTSLAALAPRAGVPPPLGGTPHAEATVTDRSRTDSLVQSARWPPYWRGPGRFHPARCRVLLPVRPLRRPGGRFGFCEGWRVEGAQTEVPPLRGGKPQSRVGHRRVTQGGTRREDEGSTAWPAGTPPAYAVSALTGEGVRAVRYA